MGLGLQVGFRHKETRPELGSLPFLHVDSFATLATLIARSLPQIILVETLTIPVHDCGMPIKVCSIHTEPSWMDPTISFIKSGTLPTNKTNAAKI